MPRSLRLLAIYIDRLFAWIDSEPRQTALERLFVALAAIGFAGHLAVIAISRNAPLFAEALFGGLDRNYLHAVFTPFSFILFYEVILLVLALPRSHTTSIEKQYQIVSLIVIRNVFKDLGEFNDLESWVVQRDAARAVLFDMAGAAAMFALVTLFVRCRRAPPDAPEPPANLAFFITLKRGTALLLGTLLIVLAMGNLVRWATAGIAGAEGLGIETYFFPTFFEAMIFTDVFLLIISIAFYDQYQYVFRNAGFVISTVLLRVSLTSPAPYDLGLALTAMVYGLVILLIFQWFDRQTAPGEG